MTYSAPTTFTTKGDATTFLNGIDVDIQRGAWVDPTAVDPASITLAQHAADWMARQDHATRTSDGNESLLRIWILPGLGHLPLPDITPTVVAAWRVKQGTAHPTRREAAYGLLRAILNDAVRLELLDRNPCRVRGAGIAKPARERVPATAAQVAFIAGEVPARYRLLVLLAFATGLRFGELAALRPVDVDTVARTVKVTRSAARTRAGREIKSPKTAGSRRTVHYPEWLDDIIGAHVIEFANAAWLFPSPPPSPHPVTDSAARRVFKRAARLCDRGDLTFHDLRHTAASNAAEAGATLKELQTVLGHTTVSAAMRYQHTSAERLAALAGRMPSPLT